MAKDGLYIMTKEDVDKYDRMVKIYKALFKRTEILKLLKDGFNYPEIGKKLFKSGRTIERDVYLMRDILGCKNNIDLILTAMRLNVIN